MSFIEDFANAKANYERRHGPGSFMAKKVHRQHWVEIETAKRLERVRAEGLPLWRRVLSRFGLKAMMR